MTPAPFVLGSMACSSRADYLFEGGADWPIHVAASGGPAQVRFDGMRDLSKERAI
jgi:hypothetical protein